MTKIFLLLLSLFSIPFFSQVNFEKGYYINNDGQRVDVLIKNKDLRNNPNSFEFKLNENSEVKTAYVKDVEMFEVLNEIKYVREKVNIDKSSKSLNNLSKIKNPEFEEKLVFLKELVSGKASLYEYNDGMFSKYFIKTEDGNIEQLIYKPYAIKNSDGETEKIAYNEEYKKQLQAKLTCSNFNTFEKTPSYGKDYLVKTFNSYNKCADPTYNATVDKSKGDFNLYLRPRINFSSLDISNSQSNKAYSFENKTGFGFGLELEYVFSINKNKWAAVIEPTYQSYKAETVVDDSDVQGGKIYANVDYKSIEIPIGIRHYMYLNDKSKLFITGQYIFDAPTNSTITMKREDGSLYNSLDVKSRTNISLGLGFNYASKYSVELKFFTNRDITHEYINWNSDYKNISLILGYNLF